MLACLKQKIKRAISNLCLDQKLIVHYCHHGTGTILFTQILRHILYAYGFRFHLVSKKILKKEQIFFCRIIAKLALQIFPPYKGGHILAVN